MTPQAHRSHQAAVRTGCLRLADGRRLEYAEWGDPDAPPVFYFHGFPSTADELRLLAPRWNAGRVRAHVIALTRPGFGASTFTENRSLLDWPTDVAEVADRLSIGRFAVLGVSGGGPYALACGYALADRITSLSVVVGLGPLDATDMELATAIQGPSSRRLIRRAQFALSGLALSRGQGARIVDASAATMSRPDQQFLATDLGRSWFTSVLSESFTQGGRPVEQEADIYRQPWGFDLRDIEVPSHLWYAGADLTVRSATGEWIASRIADSTFTLWPDHGHVTWMTADAAVTPLAAVLPSHDTAKSMTTRSKPSRSVACSI